MNTHDNWQTKAIIREDRERVAFWKPVFNYGDHEDLILPIRSIIPVRAKLPDMPDPVLAYELDVKALNIEQKSRLVEAIAARFGYTPKDVEYGLVTEGCPILAEGVTVISSDSGMMMNLVIDDRHDEDGEPDFTLPDDEWEERYPDLVDLDEWEDW